MGYDRSPVSRRASPMGFFSAPYQIVAHDVAGFGQRPYLLDAVFLCGIWADLIAEASATGPETAAELQSIDWHMAEQYLRVLSPVNTHERVAVLASFALGPNDGRVRLFSRIVRASGEPVACSWVSLECASHSDASAASIPHGFVEYLVLRDAFREALTPAKFVAAAESAAGLVGLFPDDVRALGARVAKPSEQSAPSRYGSLRPTASLRASGLALSLPGFAELAPSTAGVAFTFPGERSYDGQLLRELHAYLPYLADHFHQADDVARRYFRHAFLPLVEVDATALHDQRLERCPELRCLGVVLCGVLIAEALREHGIQPDVLIGEGLGELSALVVAGALEIGVALRLAAQRTTEVRCSPNGGAVDETSSYPTAMTSAVRFASPRFQILLVGGDDFVPPGSDLARALSTWLTHTTDLKEALSVARSAGCETFIECGPAGVLSSVESRPGWTPPALARPTDRAVVPSGQMLSLREDATA